MGSMAFKASKRNAEAKWPHRDDVNTAGFGNEPPRKKVCARGFSNDLRMLSLCDMVY